jgi:hypothetical protein
METRTRVRINLNTREVEFEGSEAFIEKYDDVIKEFIEKIKTPYSLNSSIESFELSTQKPMENDTTQVATSIFSNGLPDSFGEYYTKFPRNIKVIDKILIAAYYVQLRSSDNLLLAKEAADLLTEQNVQITNASAFIKALVNTGKLFKHLGKYKVSEKGIELIAQMYNSAGV